MQAGGEVVHQLHVGPLELREDLLAAGGEVGVVVVPAGKEMPPAVAAVVGDGDHAGQVQLFLLDFENLPEQLHRIGRHRLLGRTLGRLRLGRPTNGKREMHRNLSAMNRGALAMVSARAGAVTPQYPSLAPMV